jgi:hypothetical protein
MPLEADCVGTVPYDNKPVLGDSLGESSLFRECNRRLFYSNKGTWKAMLSMMEQGREGKSTLVIQLRTFDSSTRALRNAMTHAAPAAIAAITKARVQNTMRCGKKEQESLGANPLREISSCRSMLFRRWPQREEHSSLGQD